jgi:predicted flap endonuclease-1-like 5' DNA nuclease
MNWSWLSFIVGILVGWIIEWVIDWVFWRRKHREQQREIESLQRALDAAEAEQHDLEQKAIQCNQELSEARADLAACRADLEAAQAAAQEAATRAGPAVVIPLGDEEEPEREDLTQIEGIGPKTAALLNEAGIYNYAQLADTPVARLREIMAAAGPRYRLIVPDTWPAQARLAAEGQWDELQVLKDCIVGGVIVEHDLTKIEGIGPKIQDLLYEDALVNYHQVAAAPVERLQGVLDAAGPHYRMADPATWPEQARLAAEGQWDELEKYQIDLKGGRVTEEDLTRIEGIGPKIEGVFNEAGIINYWQLADTPVSKLEELLEAAGPAYRTADPSTWPEQARLADENKWDELQALQDRMSGGHADKQDLTKIEGIGPKIASILQDAGILNYALLADAPVERLREVLAAAGSPYRAADPATWPQQARLAAEDKWDELQALQDHLTGGREVDEPADE